MKIIQLSASNVKRLHAIEITPKGDVVEITGKNAAGKSSTLDSIFMALAGTSVVPGEPIRRGADKAHIRLDMGELIVTRKFKRQDGGKHTTSLSVESADGSSFKSPQAILDKLVSKLTFDPLEFLHAKPKDQFDMVRAFVPDVDFQKIDDQNRGDFQRRTEENRRMEEAKAAAGLIVVRDDIPDDEVDERAILDDLQNAADHNAGIERENNRRSEVACEAKKLRDYANEQRQKAAQLRAQADAADAAATASDDQAASMISTLESASALPKPIDTAQVRDRLTKAQALNQEIRKASEAYRRRASLEKVASDAALAADELTAKINARNKAKAAAIAAAAMPVPGLGFGDGFVTLNGLPFDQASSAEQLRTSIAIAMKKNTELRVILVRDGSLLDADSFTLLAEMAAENDMQVWCESVFAHSAAAIVIEDGSVREVSEEATAA